MGAMPSHHDLLTECKKLRGHLRAVRRQVAEATADCPGDGPHDAQGLRRALVQITYCCDAALPRTVAKGPAGGLDRLLIPFGKGGAV